MQSKNQFKHINKYQRGCLETMMIINDYIDDMSSRDVCSSCIIDKIYENNRHMIDDILSGKSDLK